MRTDCKNRELDAQATLQRKREEEAQAKIDAKKAGLGSRIPDRTAPVRADSLERPTERAGGPPRLALAGSKPTWREREAQKQAELAAGGGAQAPPPAPPTDIATVEAELPKKTGYVPPAKRGDGAAPRGRTDLQPPSSNREQSSGADSTTRWRPSTARSDAPRDGSPADGPAPKFVASARRGLDEPSGRSQSPAETKYVPRFKQEGASARSETPPTRTDSPTNGTSTSSAPKYVPRHLRQ